MGRPKGSKNKPNHSAGGIRPNAGRKQVELQLAAGQKLLPFGQQRARGPNQEHEQAAPAVDTEPDQPDQIEQPQPLSGDQEGNRAGETAAAAATAALDAIRQENEQRARILQHLADATSNGSLERALQELPAEEDQEYFDPIQEEEEDDSGNTIDHQNVALKRKSSAYKPKVGSTLHMLLSLVKDHLKEDSTYQPSKIRKHVIDDGHYYVEDLLGKNWLHRDPTEPSAAYLRHIRIFCWMPLRKKLLVKPISQCRCVHCGKVGFMESAGWDWKPFFYFDKIVWVVHIRDRCREQRGGCGKTCAQIDPRFLSGLPTTVAREFPFVSAGNRRIGMAEPMLYTFIEMIGRGLQFGAMIHQMISCYSLTKTHWKRNSMFHHLLHHFSKSTFESRLRLLPPLQGKCAGVLGTLAVTKGFGSVVVAGKKVAEEQSVANSKYQVTKNSNDGERQHCPLAKQKGDRDKGMHRATASPS